MCINAVGGVSFAHSIHTHWDTLESQVNRTMGTSPEKAGAVSGDTPDYEYAVRLMGTVSLSP